jgi:hypothetical protein
VEKVKTLLEENNEFKVDEELFILNLEKELNKDIYDLFAIDEEKIDFIENFLG